MQNIPFIILAVLLIIYILASIRKNKISVKASFGWFLFCIGMLFLAIWPTSLDWFAEMLGISYPPALFLTICAIISFAMDFTYNRQIDDLQKKVTDLAQEVSILKAEKNDKKK